MQIFFHLFELLESVTIGYIYLTVIYGSQLKKQTKTTNSCVILERRVSVRNLTGQGNSVSEENSLIILIIIVSRFINVHSNTCDVITTELTQEQILISVLRDWTEEIQKN